MKPEANTDKPPETLDELESQLDQTPDNLPPPDPRATSPEQLPPRQPLESQISDDVLEEAGEAADEADEEGEGNDELPAHGLHLESNPNAPRPRFWKRKRFWFSFIFLVVVAATLAWFIRPSRLAIVNTLGLRVPISITTGTVPESGQQSAVLKNVAVTVNGQAAQTDDKGILQTTARYGDVTIVAKKAGYQDVTQTVMLDVDPFFYLLGGKKRDDAERSLALQLKAVGIILKFQAKDWLTDGPLASGAFSVGDIVAKANDQGVVQLILPATDAKKATVKAAFNGSYNDKNFDVALDGSQPTVTFVPAGKNYFVSNRSGERAVYSSDLDGGNVTEVIPANSHETSAMNFTVSPGGKYGVLASTRDNKRDSQNVALQQVYVVDLTNKKMASVDSGQWVNFVDWLGDTLVYTVGERLPGASGVTQRLASVNAATGKQTTLSTAASFSAARAAVDSVVYQLSHGSDDPDADNKNPELRVVPASGGTEKNLGYKVQQLAQTDTDKVAYRTADGAWHEYNVNNSQNKNASAPANPDRAFLAATSGDGQSRLVVGTVDGKASIIVRSVASGQEKTLYSNAEITGPVRFAGANVIIFRQGNADYALSVGGGTPKKIVDVSQPTKAFSQPPGYFSFF
jgi:hypothetical protein